jgi:hypothetical protein
MGESEKTPRRSAKKTRCAIYTRKSSEEGLEQAFNSLDAQREACAAFIASQKHEGWTVTKGLEKVRAEFSLTALAYNLRRAINIVGVEGLMAAVRA